MPTKEETIRVLQTLALPVDQFAVCGGALMAEHGLRENPNDIDLLVTKRLFDQIDAVWEKRAHGSDKQIMTPYIEINGIMIEAFPSIDFVDCEKAELFIKRADVRHGIQFVRLGDMLDWKRLVLETRPKNHKREDHLRDVELLEQALLDKATATVAAYLGMK